MGKLWCATLSAVDPKPWRGKLGRNPMTFDQSQYFRMPFGEYKHRPLWSIAGTDKGLRYLGWLIEHVEMMPDSTEAIETYLSQPQVKRELELLLETGELFDGSKV